MAKRIIIATIFGIIFGIVCMLFAMSGESEITWGLAVSIILSRTLLGFGIGLSTIKWAWWLQGIVFGIIFSLPMAFGVFAGDMPDQWSIFWGSIIMGIIYGFLIELFTSVIFKASWKHIQKPAQAEAP